MLTIKNIEKINGYSLNVKGKGWYFKGWDNTLNDVTHFSLISVSPPNLLIHITLYKDGCKWVDGKNDCYVYGIWIDNKIHHYSKKRLNTPDKFRDTIEEILNGI
jgi:hypothetical protein